VVEDFGGGVDVGEPVGAGVGGGLRIGGDVVGVDCFPTGIKRLSIAGLRIYGEGLCTILLCPAHSARGEWAFGETLGKGAMAMGEVEKPFTVAAWRSVILCVRAT
jgi:hypothetical protein